MVESYYPGTVPDFCFEDTSNGVPTVKIRVEKCCPSKTLASITYDDNGIQPIMIPANSYSTGDFFYIYV